MYIHYLAFVVKTEVLTKISPISSLSKDCFSVILELYYSFNGVTFMATYVVQL